MERLLVLKLDAVGCDAEAWLNGVAVALIDASRDHATLPVHEFTMAGMNRLELVVWPARATAAAPVVEPAPWQVSNGLASAHLRILLPRAGNPVDESSARSLAQIDWAPPTGEAYQGPVNLVENVSLPVSFARWRWLDAPLAEATPALTAQALGLLQALARELSDGNLDVFVTATRLRTEELAAAYQQTHDDATRRMREHLASLHAAGAFVWEPIDAAGFWLRRLAGGRLLECLDARGEPALRTAPDAQGRSHLFPMRLAAVDGKLYVLR